mgnify:CR=1 FL=1
MVRLVSLLMNTTLTFDVGKDENGNYVRADSPKSRTLAHTKGELLDVDTYQTVMKACKKSAASTAPNSAKDKTEEQTAPPKPEEETEDETKDDESKGDEDTSSDE